MPHNIDLLTTLTSGLAAALVLGYITHRLGLSPIVGYLLAGVVIGPHTPGVVANEKLAEQLAEIGVILLMFGVGLHFHLKELLAVRSIAVPGAVGQSLAATMLGALAGRVFGWEWTAGAVFGLAISVASTVVMTRVLVDNNDLHTPAGHIAIGWLVVEDLFTVAVLVVLPTLFGVGRLGPAALPIVIGAATLKIAALIALTFILGGRIIPWLLECIALTRSRELFTLTVLVVALGIAVGSAQIFGVSMALGAFLAGMVVGRSDFSLRAATDALPMRDAFAVLFFVSVGMLFDPRFLLESPGPVAVTLAIILVGKPLAALGITLLLGYPVRVAFLVSAALAQIGEFSFILGALGVQIGILPAEANNILVASAIVAISLNPLAYRWAEVCERFVVRHPHYFRWLTRFARQAVTETVTRDDARERRGHRAVIVGYGPVGQTLTRLLRENEITASVIEMNLQTVHALRREGIPATYGDASHRETLAAAGVADAGSLILTASSVPNAVEIMRLARELNPAIRVLARTVYLSERATLRHAGADRVFSGEGEVALSLVESILNDLGATPEQIDRERARVRTDLFGPPRTPKLAPVFQRVDEFIDLPPLNEASAAPTSLNER